MRFKIWQSLRKDLSFDMVHCEVCRERELFSCSIGQHDFNFEVLCVQSHRL
jgi:hypothetical protein